MSPITALRAARPRAAAPSSGTDDRAELQLRAILGAGYPPERTSAPGRSPRPSFALNLGVAAVLLAAGTAIVVALGSTEPHPATTPTATATPSTSVAARLDVLKPGLFLNGKTVGEVFGERLPVSIAGNGCVTVGDAFLVAPKGSTLEGGIVHLAGIGDARIGGVLQSAYGEPFDWSGRNDANVQGALGCGAGQYFKVDGAYAVPSNGAAPTSLTGSTMIDRASHTLPACRFDDLVTWAAPHAGGSGGSFYQAVYVQNAGPTCSLASTPFSVSVSGAVARMRSSGSTRSLVLPTGASAGINLRQTSDCPVDHTTTRSPRPLTFVLDGRSRSLQVSFPFAAVADCGAPDLELIGYAVGESFTRPETNYSGALSRLTVSGLATGAYAGGPLDYTITVTNHGSAPFDPKGAPAFVEIATGATSELVQTGLLSTTGGPIPAGGERRFTVHSDAPAGAGAIYFFLEDGPGTSTDG